MKEIKTKSFMLRALFGLALGCAAIAGSACGGDDKPPGGNPDATCGGFAGLACAAGKFCHYEAGDCGRGDALGTCQAIPTVCTQECTAICGCDARSYCNACMAHLAGIDVSADTTCDDMPPSAD